MVSKATSHFFMDDDWGFPWPSGYPYRSYHPRWKPRCEATGHAFAAALFGDVNPASWKMGRFSEEFIGEKHCRFFFTEISRWFLGISRDFFDDFLRF